MRLYIDLFTAVCEAQIYRFAFADGVDKHQVVRVLQPHAIRFEVPMQSDYVWRALFNVPAGQWTLYYVESRTWINCTLRLNQHIAKDREVRARIGRAAADEFAEWLISILTDAGVIVFFDCDHDLVD